MISCRLQAALREVEDLGPALSSVFTMISISMGSIETNPYCPGASPHMVRQSVRLHAPSVPSSGRQLKRHRRRKSRLAGKPGTRGRSGADSSAKCLWRGRALLSPSTGEGFRLYPAELGLLCLADLLGNTSCLVETITADRQQIACQHRQMLVLTLLVEQSVASCVDEACKCTAEHRCLLRHSVLDAPHGGTGQQPAHTPQLAKTTRR